MLKVGYEFYKSRFENQRLKEENLKLELSFLRSQVNPHFLFNTLNNIYGQVVDNEKAAYSITKLADLMRYSLYDAGHETVNLTKEIAFLNDYISLERLRLIDQKKLTFNVIGTPKNQTILPLVLITYIENALKHGLHKSKDESWVDIKITIEDAMLYFKCSNKNFAKIKSNSDKVGGIGMLNTERRLIAYYPNRHKLNIQNTADKFEVELEINLDKRV